MTTSVSASLATVHEILARYGVSPEWLEVVPDVQEWCHKHRILEPSPFRAAKCFVAEGRCHMVMRDERTDAMIRSAKQLMEFNGFEEEVKLLVDDNTCLLHLVLHEIACFKLNVIDQDARDRWAFNELRHGRSDA